MWVHTTVAAGLEFSEATSMLSPLRMSFCLFNVYSALMVWGKQLKTALDFSLAFVEDC